MFFRKLLIFCALFACEYAFSEEIIPLDSFGEKRWVLTTGERDKTLPDYVGRSPSWGVREVYGREALWQAGELDNSLSPFRDGVSGSLITEITPVGADKNPALRKYNLPDLLDQLDLEGALPEGVEKISSSETGLTLFITKPTAISVSFSTYRPVRIINRSYLVLICPACDSVSFENESEKASIDFYSFKCSEAPTFGKFRRVVYTSSGKGWLSPCSGRSYEDISLEKEVLEPRAWLPQLFISLYLGRRPDELLKKWQKLYNTSLTL